VQFFVAWAVFSNQDEKSMHTPVETRSPFEEDFADLYKAHYRRVFSLCRYLLNSFDAAEDATHEVFLRSQRKLATYDPSLPFSKWLCGIATNHCIDLLRRRGTEKRIFDLGNDKAEPPSLTLTPLGEMMAAERGHDVRNALSQLPEKYRVPLVLAYYNEMSYDHIAEALGLGRNHVATLFFRGKQQLRKKLLMPNKER
jgi:RNA polymerase sigma-70 factor, ECF subfamily